MIVKGFIRSETEETMTLAEYLIWALSEAKQAYETDLPEDAPAWEHLSENDKMDLLAHEISCSDGDVEFMPEIPSPERLGSYGGSTTSAASSSLKSFAPVLA